MPQHSPIDHCAAVFASVSARELAELRKLLKAAQNDIAGLHRTVRVPKDGRRTTSALHNSPNIFERADFSAIGNLIGRDTVGELGLSSGSFSQSHSQ